MDNKELSNEVINLFMALFEGNKDFYGEYVKGDKDDNGKEKGKCSTVKQPVTFELYKKHLLGEIGLGLSPLVIDKVKFAVIDIDIYDNTIQIVNYQKAINEYNLPLVMFKSKSGGIHMYCFLKEFTDSKKITEVLTVFIAIFNIDRTTEIFPKQLRLSEKGFSNWINLPYYGDTRKALNSDLKEIDLQEMIGYTLDRLTNIQQLNYLINSLPLHDGPPCLQSMYILNNVNMREMYLFNLTIYLKYRCPDDWKNYILKANNRLIEPIDDNRLNSQVIAANDKHTYSYRCKDEPLCSRCYKEICYERKYGKESDEISNLTFEGLKQIMCDPPKYEWVINGVKMTFYSERDLKDQNKFSDFCMRYLHYVPNLIKQVKWTALLNKAFSEIEVVNVDIKDRIDHTSILAEYMAEYILETARANNKRELAILGRVYYSEETDEYFFNKKNIVKFITITKNFRHFSPIRLDEKMRELGAQGTRLYIDSKYKTIRVWLISSEKLKKLHEGEYNKQLEFITINNESENEEADF